MKKQKKPYFTTLTDAQIRAINSFELKFFSLIKSFEKGKKQLCVKRFRTIFERGLEKSFWAETDLENVRRNFSRFLQETRLIENLTHGYKTIDEPTLIQKPRQKPHATDKKISAVVKKTKTKEPIPIDEDVETILGIWRQEVNITSKRLPIERRAVERILYEHKKSFEEVCEVVKLAIAARKSDYSGPFKYFPRARTLYEIAEDRKTQGLVYDLIKSKVNQTIKQQQEEQVPVYGSTILENTHH